MLTQSQLNFVSRVIEVAGSLNDLFGELSMLQALWFGAENFDVLISDEALQAVPNLQHISNADLAEVLYIFSETRNRMNERLEPLAVVTSVT